MSLSKGYAPVFAIAFLVLHSAIWTLYATLSNTGPLHGDMIEAYSWGREFQLGYFKHPPFWAWIAGAWFEVFPRTNWAFYLLANLNSGIAVLGVWQLTGLFTKGLMRLNATLLILLYPFYTLQGHQYNANFMQLSLWPWTVYFFVLSMENRRLRDSVMFGVLAAAGMLSKYYSTLLLMSCFLASFAHPNWRHYYRSAAPYVSVAVCALLFAPHFWWLMQNNFLPFKYAEAKTHYSAAQYYWSLPAFVVGCIGFNLLAAALIWFSRGESEVNDGNGTAVSPNYERFVAILALAPFFLTVIAGIAGHVRLSTNFACPIFFLAPLLLIQTLKPSPVRLRRLATGAVGVLYAGALLAAPAIPYVQTNLMHHQPKRADEVAKEAVRMWSEITGAPLRIAAGVDIYAMGTSFYSGQNTSAFLDFDLRLSPWIKPASIAEEGFLAFCKEAGGECQAKAAQYGGPDMLQRHIVLASNSSKPESLWIFISPPKREREAAGNPVNAKVPHLSAARARANASL